MNYPDPLTQLFQGNPVAYVAGALIFVVVAMVIAIFIVRLKMPQLSWALFKSNLRGGGPVIASIYENNVVKFFTPKLFQSSIAYDGEWFIWPKAYAQSLKGVSIDEREILMSACSLINAPGQLYFNYSIQCQVANPKLVAMVQHERLLQNLKKGQQVRVPKALFQEALAKIPEDFIAIEPMTLNLPLSIKGLKEILPKSLRKHDLKALEGLVRDWVRGQGTGMNWAMIAAILAGISVIVAIVLHFAG